MACDKCKTKQKAEQLINSIDDINKTKHKGFAKNNKTTRLYLKLIKFIIYTTLIFFCVLFFIPFIIFIIFNKKPIFLKLPKLNVGY